MKKSVLFVGIMGGLLLGVNGAMAAQASTQNPITTATTNTVRKAVYNIQYGDPTEADGRSYRLGVVPQTNELTAARGNTTNNLAGVTVGNMAVVTDGTTNTTNAKVDGTHAPVKTITANTANVAVLNRDKLVTPGTGNCVSGKPCGYVSTGNDANNPQGTSSNKVWMRITNCTTTNNVTTCD